MAESNKGRQPTPQQRQGEAGESLAAEYFVERGYRVVERNFKSQLGEIDLVVEKGEQLVFVEVRARSYVSFGYPEETISRAKRRKLSLAALYYVVSRRLTERVIRFDVLAVILTRSGPRIEHIEDAFEVDFSGRAAPLLF
ncbi:MAG: YraN family protein [Myxococcales bacterium]|jgi:putative endonuclease